MTRVSHDLFVRYTIAIGGRHEAGTQAVWAHRLRQAAFESDLCGTLEQDLANRVRDQTYGLDRTAAVHLAEQWAG
jgi:hypothetical protein